MPYYTWKDAKSDKKVDVKRSVNEIDQVPDKDEALEQGMTIDEYLEAAWSRTLSPTPHVGEKGKGYW